MQEELKTALAQNQENYNENAWKDYSLQELGNFVHLLVKRSEHRSNPAKRAKDIQDARNYWLMMGQILDQISAT